MTQRPRGQLRDRAGGDRSLDLLVVSTFGGGGIHHYTDEQCQRLPDSVSVATHDMVTPDSVDGILPLVLTVVATLRAAVEFTTRDPPDIVHVHTSHRFSFYRSSFYVLYARYVWDRPVVLHVHGSSFDEFVAADSLPLRALQSAVFGASDRLIVLSDYWRDTLAQVADPAKIRVVPNAVDPDQYDPVFDRPVPRVVFVSNMIERKGVREFTDAVEALQDRVDASFTVGIAGSGPLADRVESLAGRHESVEYYGYVSEERKRALLSEGSVFVLPAYAEGLPIAMLEGMAGGNAVVSTSVGSIPEVIGEENGLLVEPRDAEALTDALAQLLTSPDRSVSMARANRAAVRDRYAWETAIARLLAVYDELQSQRATAA